ncbi:MAG: RDD family protein, partial [Bacteroidetes bacterium]|nr:RDD family protein [Bacteroidota bacterium]
LYNPFCEIFFNGQTIGKRALNIRAIKLDRSRSDFQSFLIRSVFRMVDINLCGGTLAFVMISSSPKRQRLGDLLAHTAVVKTESRVNLELNDLLKIDTIEKYTPTYMQVRLLNDEDIITIRQVLERFRNHPNQGHHEALNALVSRLCEVLEIDYPRTSSEVFLRTLVKDYIVLTR